MASNLTLYDSAGNPVVVSGEDMKGLGGIGVDQTWQDMSGSRTFDVVYTNNTGRPIMIAIEQYLEGSWNDTMIDGVKVTQSYSSTGVEARYHQSFIIPNGSTYELHKKTAGAINSIGKWMELR